MSIPSTPQIDQLVEKLYQSGEFQSRTEVIDRALRLLQRRQEVAQLVEVGLEELDAGELTTYGEHERDRFVADIVANSRDRMAGASQ